MIPIRRRGEKETGYLNRVMGMSKIPASPPAGRARDPFQQSKPPEKKK